MHARMYRLYLLKIRSRHMSRNHQNLKSLLLADQTLISLIDLLMGWVEMGLMVGFSCGCTLHGLEMD